jgi:hypothetical protein
MLHSTSGSRTSSRRGRRCVVSSTRCQGERQAPASLPSKQQPFKQYLGFETISLCVIFAVQLLVFLTSDDSATEPMLVQELHDTPTRVVSTAGLGEPTHTMAEGLSLPTKRGSLKVGGVLACGLLVARLACCTLPSG